MNYHNCKLCTKLVWSPSFPMDHAVSECNVVDLPDQCNEHFPCHFPGTVSATGDIFAPGKSSGRKKFSHCIRMSFPVVVVFSSIQDRNSYTTTLPTSRKSQAEVACNITAFIHGNSKFWRLLDAFDYLGFHIRHHLPDEVADSVIWNWHLLHFLHVLFPSQCSHDIKAWWGSRILYAVSAVRLSCNWANTIHQSCSRTFQNSGTKNITDSKYS